MRLLGISVVLPWVDHPYTDRGRYVNPYARSNQYVQRSGWSSQIAPGNLPASHMGGALGSRQKTKPKGRREAKRKRRRKRGRSAARAEYDLPPGQSRAIFGAKHREALREAGPTRQPQSRPRSRMAKDKYHLIQPAPHRIGIREKRYFTRDSSPLGPRNVAGPQMPRGRQSRKQAMRT